MPRNLDSSLAAALANKSVMPAFLVAIQFKSGMSYVWSGVGDLAWNGNTFKGVGAFTSIGAVQESSGIEASGTSIGLSGLSASGFVISGAPSGMVSPYAPGAGQYVAWAKPTTVSNGGSSTNHTVVAGLDSAVLTFSEIGALGDRNVWAEWSNFQMPPLPADAVILGVTPCALVSGDGKTVPNAGYGNNFGAGIPGSGTFSSQYNGGGIASTAAAIEAATLQVNIGGSVEGGGPGGPMVMTVSGIGIAILYSSATGSVSLLGEALDDVQLGAPATIWLGLLSGGALIGNPYKIFAGLVDQPTIRVAMNNVDISLALESRLSDLARPSARRYTAADQKLFYPDDSGFDWVETLNDVAERWGG